MCTKIYEFSMINKTRGLLEDSNSKTYIYNLLNIKLNPLVWECLFMKTQTEQHNGMKIFLLPPHLQFKARGTRKILVCNVLHTKFLASFL